MSTPASTIYCCSGVLLNNAYIHTIWFESDSAQRNYFQSKVVKTFNAYTYIRKSWSIKVESTMEQARKWNYLFFRNSESGKMYYYFINNIEYINDNTVELFIEMDVLQTYAFDYYIPPCFVEREHSETDVPGENLLDEGLDVGDYIINNKSNVDMQDLCVLMLSSIDPLGTTEERTVSIRSQVNDKVFSGLGVFAIPMTEISQLGTTLNNLDTWGKSDGILSMWMYPKRLVNLAGGNTWTDEYFRKMTDGGSSFDHTISINGDLDGYTPRNKKLLCYPYNFIYASNNAGGSALYRYEQFNNSGSCSFRVMGTLSPDGSVKMFPISYQGITINYEEGLTGSNYPTCAWNQDVYKLWLAQNQHQQKQAGWESIIKFVGGGAGLAASPWTGGTTAIAGAGLVYSGLTGANNLLAARADKEIQPPQAKGNFSTAINLKAEHQTFTFLQKSINADYARRLDEYFDLYGYKCLRKKSPNKNVRENWTYTKTLGCHATGNLCTDDLLKIQSIFDNGITFWKNGDNIGQYDLSNECILG